MDSIKQPEYFIVPNELLNKMVNIIVKQPAFEVMGILKEIDSSIKPYENQANDTDKTKK